MVLLNFTSAVNRFLFLKFLLSKLFLILIVSTVNLSTSKSKITGMGIGIGFDLRMSFELHLGLNSSYAAVSAISAASGVSAVSGSQAVPVAQVKLCDAAGEFKKSIEMLKQEDGLNLNEGQMIKEALMISQGCDHASVRFKEIYSLLKKSGVDLKSSFSIALQFATKSDEQTRNFLEVFKKIYLEN